MAKPFKSYLRYFNKVDRMEANLQRGGVTSRFWVDFSRFIGSLMIIGLWTMGTLWPLPFNDRLTAEDEKVLSSGAVIARSIDKLKNASLVDNHAASGAMLLAIKNMNPNYLAEMIQIRDVKKFPDLLDRLESVLLDIPHYAGIPYWSEQHQRFWDLYEKAEITNKRDKDPSDLLTSDGRGVEVDAALYMEPFGDIDSLITFYRGEDYLLFINENKNTLKLKGMNAVSKGKMKSAILVLRSGDSWVLYALGGCKTFKIAGFQKRIETSLINRIKTFINYVFTNIDKDSEAKGVD